jgi:hypothetical protein
MTEIPSQWSHSVKLEETAKGVRIHVHVYANNQEDAIAEALETYMNTRNACKENKIPLAPMEVNDKK